MGDRQCEGSRLTPGQGINDPVAAALYPWKLTWRNTPAENVRGSWKEEFAGTEKKIRLDIDIGAKSAKLHLNVEDPSSSGALTSQAEFECLSESDDGLFLAKDNVSKEIQKWSDVRAFYALKKYACFKFDREKDFLKVGIYSFDKEPANTDTKEVCSGMDQKELFNTIGFSPADKE